MLNNHYSNRKMKHTLIPLSLHKNCIPRAVHKKKKCQALDQTPVKTLMKDENNFLKNVFCFGT